MTYQYTESGLDNIYLSNGYEHVETGYGKATVVHNTEGLHQAIAFSLCEGANLKGVEFRYLRHFLDFSQKVIGNLMGATDQAVAKWEKGAKVPKYAEVIIKTLCKEKVLGNVEFTKLITEISQLDHDMQEQKLLIEETENGWQLKAA